MRSQDPMDVPLLGAGVHPPESGHSKTSTKNTLLINQAHGFLDASARLRGSGLGTTSERSFALAENTL
jgi:hypothetical protein